MKKLVSILIISLFFVARVTALAQNSTGFSLNPYYISGVNILPRNTAWQLNLPNILNCNGASVLETSALGVIQCGADGGGGGGSQTPWTSDIDANGYTLNNILGITATDSMSISSGNVLSLSGSGGVSANTLSVSGAITQLLSTNRTKLAGGLFASGTAAISGLFSVYNGIQSNGSSTLLNVSNFSGTNGTTTNEYVAGSFVANGASSTVTNLKATTAVFGTPTDNISIDGTGNLILAGAADIDIPADTYAFKGYAGGESLAGVFFRLVSGTGNGAEIQFKDTSGNVTCSFAVTGTINYCGGTSPSFGVAGGYFASSTSVFTGIINTASSTLLGISNLGYTNGTGTNEYLTGAFSANGASSTITNLVTTRATSTSATTTNFYVQGGGAILNTSSTSIVSAFNVNGATSTWQLNGAQMTSLAVRNIFATVTGQRINISTVNSTTAGGAGSINLLPGNSTSAGGRGGAIFLQPGAGGPFAVIPGSGSDAGAITLQGNTAGGGSADDDSGGGGAGGLGTTITLQGGNGGVGGNFSSVNNGPGGNGGSIILQLGTGGLAGTGGGTNVNGQDGSFIVRMGALGNATTGIFALQSGASGNLNLFRIATTSAATSTGLTFIYGGIATSTLIDKAIQAFTWATSTASTPIIGIDTNVGSNGRVRIGGVVGMRENAANTASTNAYAGLVRMVAGSATVNTTYTIDDMTRIVFSAQSAVLGTTELTATTSNSFTFTSLGSVIDTALIYWEVRQNTRN